MEIEMGAVIESGENNIYRADVNAGRVVLTISYDDCKKLFGLSKDNRILKTTLKLQVAEMEKTIKESELESILDRAFDSKLVDVEAIKKHIKKEIFND